ILTKWCLRKEDKQLGAPDEKRKNGDKDFDLPRLLELYGEDGMKELLQSFLTESESLLKAIAEARLNKNEKEFLA
ncbi:hypothetical protein ACTUM1_15890, partial [Listeria monocytogenes]|uniref:hypothetical protein n=1 Tax=Listeria monocytogenes TaxID=1639 RepID=UPI003FA498A5